MNEASEFKFVIRNWNIASNQSNTNYSVGKEIIQNAEILKSNLRDNIKIMKDYQNYLGKYLKDSYFGKNIK